MRGFSPWSSLSSGHGFSRAENKSTERRLQPLRAFVLMFGIVARSHTEPSL